MKSKKLLFMFLLITLVVVSFLAVPLASTAQSPTTGGKTEIVLGAINSLTGINVLTGAEQKWAQEQAVADINAAGGVMFNGQKIPFRLVYEDDQSTADGAAAAMEKLIKVDKVDVTLSTNITPLNEAAATVAAKYNMFFAINTSWTDFIRKDKFPTATDMFFSTISSSEVPFLVWNSYPADLRPTKIAVLTEDNPDGQGFGAGFQTAAKKYNYNIVDYDAYTPGAKDLSSNILKMKSTGADALLWLGSPPDGITLVQQIKAQNLNLKYIHGWKGLWDVQVPQALGPDANYLIHDGFWVSTLGTPGSKELGDKFVAAHNGQDSVSIGLPYASVQVVKMAIEKANSVDAMQLRNAIVGATFTGTTMGDVTFDADGICETPSFGLQWWSGQRKQVWPLSANWQLQWMPPWNQRQATPTPTPNPMISPLTPAASPSVAPSSPVLSPTP